MQFTHAGNNGLAGLFVSLDAERRIFLGKATQSDRHLFLVSLGLRFHGHRDHRLRKLHTLKRDDIIFITQRITRGNVLQTDNGGDITRTDFLDFFTLVGMHLQHTAYALLLALTGFQTALPTFQHTRVDANKGQGTHVRVIHDLERQRRERLHHRRHDAQLLSGLVVSYP
jgi:hypothetical protein